MNADLIDHMPRAMLAIGANVLGLGYRLNRYSKSMRSILAKWQEMEHLPVAQLEVLQTKRLRHVLRLAAKAPFYSERFREAGFDPNRLSSLQEMQRIPVLTRQDIRDYGEHMLVPGSVGPVIDRKSSGTTGEPIRFKQPRKLAFDYAYAALYQGYAWHGIQPLARRATLAGRYLGSDPEGVVLRNYFENQLLLGAHGLYPDAAKRYIDALRKFKPQILQAHPSALLLLRKYALKLSLAPLQIPVVAFTGESLLDAERLKLSEWVEADVFGQYGSGEHHLAAAECLRGNGYHINPAFSYTELIPDGSCGHVVSTSLLNTVMPLIRYEIGDMAERIDTTQCACGRTWPRLMGLQGRVDDALSTASGRSVAPVIFRTGLAAHFSELPPYTIIQHKKPGRYSLQLFTEKPTEEFSSVAKYLEDILKPNACVEIATFPPSEQFTQGGKRKIVIRE